MRGLPKAFVILVLFSVAGYCQTFRGGIAGTVTDPSGAVIPGAVVKATNTGTTLSNQTLSSSAGEFSFQDLPLGDYTITVVQSGFEPLKINGVRVSGGAIYNLPIKLNVAQTTSTVEVSAAAVSVETTTVAQTNDLPEETVQDLPVNGRNFTQMIALSAGFAGYGGSGAFNGSRSGQVNQQIDGIDNNDAANNSSAANQGGIQSIPGVLFPLDAIEEFSVQSQGGAETGRSPGAVVNLIVKSGTNQVHGTAYYYNRNEALAANSPFAAPGSPKSEIRNQNFGGSVGGPIIKDKTFLFLTYEEQKFIIGEATYATEPSYAYQAAAKQLLAQSGVPVNPVAQNLLNTLWPSYLLNGPAAANNYYATTPETGYSHNGLAKLDHSINDSNRLSFRWYAGQGSQTAPLSSFIPWYYQVGPMHVENYSAVLNSTVSPSITNQVLAGVNYFHQAFSDANSSFDPAASGFVTGITGPFLGGAPNLNINGFDQTGLSPISGRQDYTAHIVDTASIVKGTHQIRLGAEYRRTALFEIGAGAGNNWGGRGNFSFTGQVGPWSSLLSAKGYDTNIASLADFMAGDVFSSTIEAGNVNRNVSLNSVNLFVNDTWQVTRSLNLNLGLRWDYLSPFGDGDHNLSTFDPNVPGGIAVVGEQISQLYPSDFKQFSPRIGLAYQPGGINGLVFRAGFGVYYDTPSGNTFLAQGSLSNNGAIGMDANPAGSSPVFAEARSGYTIVPGQPIFPTSLCICGNNVFGLFGVAQNFTPSDTMNFSANVEKSLGNNVILQVGYVGSEGRHLVTISDINQAALGANFVKGTNAAGFSYLQQSRPYFSQFPNFGAIDELQSNGTSNYNSLQVTLRTKSWHGLISQFAYTWGHNLEELASGSTLPQNSFNIRGDYGNASYDIRHQFKGYMVYDIPGSSWGPKWLTHGWQANSNLYLRTGRPVLIKASSDTSGTLEGTQRANIISDPFADETHDFVTGQSLRWFNPAAFVNPASGTFGSMQKDSVFGPGFASVDFSMFKNIPITERVRAQFRVEMFNVFNRVNLAQPSAKVGSSLGLVGSTIGASSGQPGIGPGEPFNVQLAMKILF
ncbi:MAG TPA: TonB-dependent receptor [Bryobacteraceae bacterium]|nr:TonB-dependent receptor [Bryobacteraceae bacterium]